MRTQSRREQGQHLIARCSSENYTALSTSSPSFTHMRTLVLLKCFLVRLQKYAKYATCKCSPPSSMYYQLSRIPRCCQFAILAQKIEYRWPYNYTYLSFPPISLSLTILCRRVWTLSGSYSWLYSFCPSASTLFRLSYIVHMELLCSFNSCLDNIYPVADASVPIIY